MSYLAAVGAVIAVAALGGIVAAEWGRRRRQPPAADVAHAYILTDRERRWLEDLRSERLVVVRNPRYGKSANRTGEGGGGGHA